LSKAAARFGSESRLSATSASQTWVRSRDVPAAGGATLEDCSPPGAGNGATPPPDPKNRSIRPTLLQPPMVAVAAAASADSPTATTTALNTTDRRRSGDSIGVSCRAAHSLRFSSDELAEGRTERNVSMPFSEIGSNQDSSRSRIICNRRPATAPRSVAGDGPVRGACRPRDYMGGGAPNLRLSRTTAGPPPTTTSMPLLKNGSPHSCPTVKRT